MIDNNILTEEEVDIDHAVSGLLEQQIVVYNDDVNSFEHVILCFIKYCNHDLIQAEQCALVIHNNGKCAVKNGMYNKLKPICEALLDNGLRAKIE